MNSNSNNFREMFWDESNRLRVVYDQNSYQMQHYIYDAAGERTLKASSKIENVYENGQVESNNTTMGLYTTYVSPYMVVDANQKYSKHYFNGTQRVASKIGEQDIAIFENGNQYLKQTNSKAAENTPSTDFDTLKNKQITDFSYYLSKSTNNTTAKNLKVNYTEYKKVDTNTETTSAKAADNNSAFAAQQYAEIYYYHSDHLGTGTFLSDFDGNPYQFFLNLPFGETMAEQHSYSGEYTNRYKFNGKELEEETGFYYYGARYYNPKFSIWLSVDPLAEKYPSISPYAYVANNPINAIDPDGRDIVYLNKNGSVNRVVNDGRATIRIVEYNSKIKRSFSSYDITRGLIYWNNDNRQIIANVAGYYSKNLGLKDGVTIGATYEKGESYAFTEGKNIFINPGLDGKISSVLDNKYNLISTIEHEVFHSQEKDHSDYTFSEHCNVYLKQFGSNNFSKTSTDFQESMAGSFFEYLRGAQHYQEKGWDNLMKDFNNTYKNINGFQIKTNKEGVLQLFDKDGNQRNDLKPFKTDAY